MSRVLQPSARSRGFSLIEMTLVLILLGILLKATLIPLAARQGERQQRELEQQLALIERVLIGHLIRQGALPCPLSAASDAVSLSEATSTAQPCEVVSGLLPARIGLPGATDARGALLDPWGHPYRYALARGNGRNNAVGENLSPWSIPGQAAELGPAALEAELRICNALPSGKRDCEGQALRASGIVFVILSAGADARVGTWRVSEVALASFADQPQYDWLERAPSLHAEERFDDTLLWMSREEAIYWLLRSGWLP